MADPYVISDNSEPQYRTAPEVSRSTVLRTVTWLALLICAVGNVVVSARGGAVAAHAVLGAATLLCLITLVVSHVRRGQAGSNH